MWFVRDIQLKKALEIVNVSFRVGCKLKECPPTVKYVRRDWQRPKIETVANITLRFFIQLFNCRPHGCNNY